MAASLAWAKVDVLTAYQRLTAEIQVRGRLRETINDPEQHFHLRNVSAEPLLPGAVPLGGVVQTTVLPQEKQAKHEDYAHSGEDPPQYLDLF